MRSLVVSLAVLAALAANVRAIAAADPPTVHPALAAHSAEFEKRIYEVTDGVYSAVGYALANSILLEGEDGVVIVDVTESVEAAREILADFRLTSPPDITVTGSSAMLLRVMMGATPMSHAVASGALTIDGELEELGRFLRLFGTG